MTSDDPVETAVSRLKNRIPASLYEVAWQYSLLDWFDATQSDAIDWDLAPEHLAYLTPRAKSGLFGADDSLVVVYADLSTPNDPELRSDDGGGPVEITAYTRADRFRVGHSYPERKTSNMTDYSITTQKGAEAHHIAGLRDDAWGTNNIRDRFTDWAQSEYAQTVRKGASEADAAVIEALATLGDDADAMDRLTESFLSLVEGEDEEIDALITVAVKLPGADDYCFPGEVDVLNEVMRVKKAARLENISVENASGEGTGYVTSEDGTVTGGSPGLFGMYGKKQREHFPDLDTDGESAWRSRPIEFDTAAAVAAAGSLFDDFYRGLGQDRRLYVLPYLTARGDELPPETFEWFYERVYKRLQQAEGGSDGTFDATLEQIMIEASRTDDEPAEIADEPEGLFASETTADWDDVRVAVIQQVTGNPSRVFFDTLDGLAPTVKLENAHNEITAQGPFVGDGVFADRPVPDSSPLLGQGLQLAQYILYGGYFQRTVEPTRSSREATDRPTAGDIDDDRMRRVRQLLTGTRLDGAALLRDYLHQLVQDQREQFGNDSDYMPFPTRSIAEQYAQLRALTAVDALTSTTITPFRTTTMPDNFDSRTDRLEEFIESHDALDGDPEQAVFLLGALVGRVSAYQRYEGVSSTLIRRYPIDYLTKQTVMEVSKEVLQMNNDYAEVDNNRSYWTNSRYTDRLADTMLTASPRTWRLTEVELQWLYGLGIAYGLRDSGIEEEDAETAAVAEADT
jgi:hypothetical protein